VKRSYLTILVASALLPSAARTARAEPRSEHHASTVETHSRDSYANSDPIATPINQPTAHSTSTEGGRVTYNYNGDFKYVAPTATEESGWKKFSDIANVASAIAVAFFTGMLWCVSRQQKELMQNAEAISRRSVEVTELALTREKIPLVFVKQPERPTFLSGVGNNRSLSVTYKFKNYGNGPAFMYSMAVNCAGLEEFSLIKLVAPIDRTFSSGEVIPAGEDTPLLQAECRVPLTDEEWRTFSREPTSKRKFFLYGEIAYTDIWDDKWVTGFAWIYDIMQQRMRIATQFETPAGYNFPPRKEKKENKTNS
jgi:hypothetical protein